MQPLKIFFYFTASSLIALSCAVGTKLTTLWPNLYNLLSTTAIIQQEQVGSGQQEEEGSGPVDETDDTFPPVGFTQLTSSPDKAIRILENREKGVDSGAKCTSTAAGARLLTFGSFAEMSEVFQLVQNQANTKRGCTFNSMVQPGQEW